MRLNAYKFLAKITAAATIFTSVMTVMPARAATMDTLSDTMTRVKISTESDHNILFDLPSTITFDASTNDDAITLTFPSDFVLAGTFVAGDFTIQQDQSSTLTTLTIADVNSGATGETPDCSGAGADEIAVAVNTTPRTIEIQACSTVSYTASDAAGTIRVAIASGGADGTITNPTTPGSYAITASMEDEGSAAAHTGTMSVGIADDDQVSVTATVDPSLTFDIDTSVADGETDDPYSVALGTLAVGSVRVSGSTDTINMIILEADTNASGGVIVTVQNANGANGLASTSVPADNIGSADGTMAAGTENYGLCVITASLSGFAVAGDYNGDTCATNSETNVVEGLTTTPASIVSTTAPVSGGHAEVAVQAAISGVTAAHNDYTDTLTFIATATF